MVARDVDGAEKARKDGCQCCSIVSAPVIGAPAVLGFRSGEGGCAGRGWPRWQTGPAFRSDRSGDQGGVGAVAPQKSTSPDPWCDR